MRSIEEVETRLRSLPASVELRPADDRALGVIHLGPRPDIDQLARELYPSFAFQHRSYRLFLLKSEP